MHTIRVAIIGVGNCASSLIQSICFYYNQEVDIGLMHPDVGGYKIKDIRVVCAFDIDKRKVDDDLGRAIFARPNCTRKFANPGRLGVTVKMGHVLDGLGAYSQKLVSVTKKSKPSNIFQELRRSRAEVVVNFLPTGAERATQYYAREALRAGCAFVNCIPVSIASNPLWQKKYRKANVPLLGDDIKSQIGATILHRALVDLLIKRGVKIDTSYQLNVGGNSDFLNLMEPDRIPKKLHSKRSSITSLIPYDANIFAAPASYINFLADEKVAYISISGRNMGANPVSIECKMSVWDSPNSAGVVATAIRVAKLALDRKYAGPVAEACAWLFKLPPLKEADHKALEQFRKFVDER